MEDYQELRTLIDETRKVIILDQPLSDLTKDGSKPLIAVPEQYTLQDVEKYLPQPLRKRCTAGLLDTPSFIRYVQKHGIADQTVIYVNTDFEKQTADLLAVIDDHGSNPTATSWRTHKAIFQPTKTVEWKRWHENNGQFMTQADFACFLEENLPDIAAGIDGMPTGTDMLQMAIAFEATADKRFKQKVNIQSAGINLEYVNTDSAETVERMRMFERFSLGLAVFVGGAPYRVDARLKYRQNGDKLSFRYQLIRSDRVFEQAIKDEITKVQEATNFLIVTGRPGTE